MGAGHDGAARELCRRLDAQGATTRTVDFLEAAPWFGHFLRALYGLVLRSAPWGYEATYRVWFMAPLLCRPTVALLSLIFGRRLRRWAGEFGAHSVVSTYPLASMVLGRDRRRGRLGVPVSTFLTDFAVHPLWVHPGVDQHICVHDQSARQVAASCPDTAVAAPGPLVPGRFSTELPDRADARRRLGIDTDARVVLVVAGSWGVGELEETFDQLLAAPAYYPVVVCGANERLRQRLSGRGGLVLGWTHDMPALMAAADVLVQNGGGLTCMEAFAAGLPVVTVRPIPGHGRQNAEDMARAGVAAYVTDPAELLSTLDRITTLAGYGLTARAREMFSGDAAADVMATVVPDVQLAEARSHPLRRRAGRVAMAAAALYAGLNLAADTATAHGLGVAEPSDHSHTTYVAVRVSGADLNDPGLAPLLARYHITAIVEGDIAVTHRAGLRQLATAGVQLANGGWGNSSPLHLIRADDGVLRARQAIDGATHVDYHLAFAPDQAVNGMDLASAHLAHERVVQPGTVISPDDLALKLQPGRVYVVDAESTPPLVLQRCLARLDAVLSARHLNTAPLDSLP
jgi:processive 1,2-diacylglycerol beta-glucosyltransferase